MTDIARSRTGRAGTAGPAATVAADDKVEKPMVQAKPVEGQTPADRPSASRGFTRLGWLPGIEALRGIAAAMVVLHHSWSLSTQPHFPGYQVIEGFGSLGVNLFFLLSGFLLADQFWRPKEQRSLRGFWIRRLFRIAPAYYVTVGVLFLFFAEHSLLFSEQGVRQIVANATFMQYLFPSTSSSLNVDGALWTLTAEFLLYLTLPLMALPFLRWPKLAFVVLVSIGVGWRLWIAVGGDGLRELYFGPIGTGPDPGIQSVFLSRQFPGIVPIFAFGIALKYLVTRGHLDRLRSHLPQYFSVPLVVISLVPALAILFFVERASDYHHWIWFTGFDYAVALLLVPVLLIAAQPGNPSPSVVGRGATWLGDRSYSLYIWHFPIILSVYGRGPLVNPPDVSHIWAKLTLIAVLALITAQISYVALEKPGIAFGRKIAARYSKRPAPKS